jgi:hypothetical protein
MAVVQWIELVIQVIGLLLSRHPRTSTRIVRLDQGPADSCQVCICHIALFQGRLVRQAWYGMKGILYLDTHK